MTAKRKNRQLLTALAVLALSIGVAFLPITGREIPAEAAFQPYEHLYTLPMKDFMADDIADTGYLALINRQHPISASPGEGLLVPAWPAVPVSVIQGMYLHPSALRAVAEMLSSAGEADIGTFFVSSGYRGYELQAQLYNGGENSAFALPPGHSEHHTGLAADIMALGVSQRTLGNSPQGRWLAENSYRYGLILRYPRGAESVTGIEFEPWHFRYVGKVHAYFMKQNNLVLEEYIQLIRRMGSISFEKNNTKYLILFQEAEDGTIKLPYGMDFSVSSDNISGFIITAWER